MMFMDELYQESVAENENNLAFWEQYLNGLKSLNFDEYAEKLKVPILVPIGNKILFRGELKHTNEVTVALGADYFVKCSTAQAENLKQHRIKDAQLKVDLYKKEKEYLKNRISLTKENVFEKGGQEILEEYSEEEDKSWREKHRKNVKKHKQSQAKETTTPKDDTNDTELWERLEELELQEELENELLDNYNEIVDNRKENSFLQKEEALLRNSFKDEITNQNTNNGYPKGNKQQVQFGNKINRNEELEMKSNHNKEIATDNVPNENSKHELLQKVLDKQNELENKLHEIQHKKRDPSKTKNDLIARLDEMEMLDELEDEMERLDDIIKTEDVETGELTEDEDILESRKLKKRISFPDEGDSETLEIPFSHTDMEPNTEPFDPEKGITKPRDLYEAYSQLFVNKTTSILKKSKYELEEKAMLSIKQSKQVMFEENAQILESQPEETPIDRTIVIKDVVENICVNQHKVEGGARPTSLFKKKRMQNK